MRLILGIETESLMREHFDLIMDIGELMLVCGAEVHRVEDSIKRMCSSLDVERTDVFIIISSMVVTVHNADKAFTQTRRIKSIGTDIEKLHMLNELSRKICSDCLSAEEIRSRLEKIRKTKSYPLWVEMLSYMLITGGFAVFFGGNFFDAITALVIGATLRFIILALEKISINKIFEKLLCSFIVSCLAFVAMKAGIISTIDKVMIGNVMVLIPGIGLTNAIRDLFVGDSVSGLLRLIEATLMALAVAAGYFLFVFLLGGIAV